MSKTYIINWRQGMSGGRPLQFDASSPKGAAVKAGKWLGYVVEEKINGEKKSYITSSCEFDGSVPLSLCVFENKTGAKHNYYNVIR